MTFHFGYDERWRIVATYRSTDTSPKELFVYHCAGGMGGSSYIDAVVLREMDANTNWVTGTADALESRDYYCQNWRADVVAVITGGGSMRGMVRYSAYGIPFGIPTLDTNGDGLVNSADSTNITNWTGTGNGVTNPTADHNLDGNIDSNDANAYTTRQNGVTLGWGVLAQNQATGGGAVGANRKGYAGYEFDPILTDSNWHVRHRVLKSDLGRWTRRDPIAQSHRDFYMYVSAAPLHHADSMGTDAWIIGHEGFNSNALKTHWKPIANREGKQMKVFRDDHQVAALNFAKAKLEEVYPHADIPCACREHSISVAGYSWGAHSAIQLAERIAALPATRDVILGFTADPICCSAS